MSDLAGFDDAPTPVALEFNAGLTDGLGAACAGAVMETTGEAADLGAGPANCSGTGSAFDEAGVAMVAQAVAPDAGLAGPRGTVSPVPVIAAVGVSVVAPVIALVSRPRNVVADCWVALPSG